MATFISGPNKLPNSLTPVFSIIIPVFNSAQSLTDNLQSIAAQNFKEYEIIFVDGASTDNTVQRIADFQNLNSDIKIKLLSAPDRGIYDAMNKGINLAEGEWLYFMGCDDRLYSPVVLSAIHREIEKENADLVYGNVLGITSKIKYVYDTVSKVLSTGIHHQSIFYKARLFKELGKYELNFKIAADYHFTLKVFLNRRYVTRYINQDIAWYGEGGYSSKNFDYKFYSGHYRMLASNNAIGKIDEPEKCLENSVYCCLYLAKEKKDLRFAWRNLLYYTLRLKGPDVSFSIKTITRMVMWSLKPKPGSPQV
ncbi:hypothetical protein BH09BAC6_BH09BAC6_01430 [soil metagenome]